MILPRENSRYSIRPWRVWSLNTRAYRPSRVWSLNTRAYLVQASDQRGTRLVEKPSKGALCL